METVFTAAIVIVLIILVIKIFTKPIKWILKLLINTVIGFVALIVINAVGSLIGVSIGINWINALVVGILGMPGVGLLLVLQWLL